MNREDELRRDGWEKRTVLDEPRFSEVVELYQLLDFEVLIEPVKPTDFKEECKSCYVDHCDKFLAIYIRKNHSK